MMILLFACTTPEPGAEKPENSQDSQTQESQDSNPDSEADSGKESVEELEGPSFVEVVMPITDQKCAGCHYSEPEGLPLYGEGTDDLLVNVPSKQLPSMDRVEPGSLEQSYLWHKLQDSHKEVGGSGQMMPSVYGEPLTEQEKEIFRSWITGGAKP